MQLCNKKIACPQRTQLRPKIKSYSEIPENVIASLEIELLRDPVYSDLVSSLGLGVLDMCFC